MAIDMRLLAGVAAALQSGDDNAISGLIENKLQKMGANFLAQMLATQQPAGFNRFGRFLATGGASEFSMARDTWLNKLRPAPIPGAKILQKLANQLSAQRPERPEGKYWKWSPSRREWLDQNWKHDWRSQPRDWHGRWMIGRLRTPYVPRRIKRQRRALRRVARKAARSGMEY